MRKIIWTRHAEKKLREHALSVSRILRAIHSPDRIESGLAENTIAVIKKAGSVKHPFEIWVMFSDKTGERTIISAWRYPGVTKPGEALPEGLINRISIELDSYRITA